MRQRTARTAHHHRSERDLGSISPEEEFDIQPDIQRRSRMRDRSDGDAVDSCQGDRANGLQIYTAGRFECDG